ncbi:MAG TPA: hypothetical protein PL117_13855 [Accumulibacter sp.]|uniref:hypothetical protein n=1 Tax=Accumulibacter sp. TaxID=2053492 RepID=UPI000EDAB6E1|nr:hypothetical protein [Accumulibacter sp.]HCZ14690.1 hypothetical protein [Accumulibacter sp.]HRD92103.1 hypothetical protein [Accumulibacter sp.]HRF73850.1 hypothetical protein [Accumulibacter sp.]
MKSLMMSLSAALVMMTAVADASAVTCAEGVRRAGCVGPNGAVVARKPVAAAPATAVVVAPAAKAVVIDPAPKAVVVTPAHGCRYVNGAKVCR